MNENQKEIKARKLAIELSKEWNGKKKADLWVCGDRLMPNGMKVECDECHNPCYCDSKLVGVIKKKHKKVCLLCALKEDLNPEQRAIIERALL